MDAKGLLRRPSQDQRKSHTGMNVRASAMSELGQNRPSRRTSAYGGSAFESGKSSPPGGIWRLAAQLLGYRPDQYLSQGKLPSAHQPFHRRAEFPLRK